MPGLKSGCLAQGAPGATDFWVVVLISRGGGGADGGFGLPLAAFSGDEGVDLMDRKNEAIWAFGFGLFER